MTTQRVWMKHRRKPEWEMCPRCFSPLKWIYDGFDWIPCDREPVLFYPNIGDKHIVYRKELISNAALYRDKKRPALIPCTGHRPHVCTCEEIKNKTYK